MNWKMKNDWHLENLHFTFERNVILNFTHSMPSINGVSVQSFSGNRCKIFPLRFPDPVIIKTKVNRTKMMINEENVRAILLNVPYIVRLRHDDGRCNWRFKQKKK